MTQTLFGRITLAIFIGLVLFGLVATFTYLDQKELQERFKDNPQAVGVGFFLFSQGLSATTPVWMIDFVDGQIQIPCPDTTDMIGLFIFALLGIAIIRSTKLKENYIVALIIFILILICGWLIWKIIVYYLFLTGADMIGLTYLEATEIRNLMINETDGNFTIALFIFSIFTLLSAVKFIPHSWN
jgi:hypothetical protein